MESPADASRGSRILYPSASAEHFAEAIYFGCLEVLCAGTTIAIRCSADCHSALRNRLRFSWSRAFSANAFVSSSPCGIGPRLQLMLSRLWRAKRMYSLSETDPDWHRFPSK